MPQTVILATAGYDHRIRFWDANTGACSRQLRFEESQVNALQISPNKSLLAAAGNPAIQLFDVASMSEGPCLNFEGHTNNVTSIGFHKETQWMYSCSEDGTVKIWDLRAPDAQRTFDCNCAVHSVVVHPNQRTVISADQNGCVKVWDVVAGDKYRSDVIVSPDSPLRSLAIVIYFPSINSALMISFSPQTGPFWWRLLIRAKCIFYKNQLKIR